MEREILYGKHFWKRDPGFELHGMVQTAQGSLFQVHLHTRIIITVVGTSVLQVFW